VAKSRFKCMTLVEEYFNIEKVFSPFLIILSIILITLSLKGNSILLDKLVIGISVLIIALLMLIEGISKKILVTVRIGLTPPVYIIIGLFLIFESIRRLTANFTSYFFQSSDFVLFLIIFTLGIHFLHIAGLMKFEN